MEYLVEVTLASQGTLGQTLDDDISSRDSVNTHMCNVYYTLYMCVYPTLDVTVVL